MKLYYCTFKRHQSVVARNLVDIPLGGTAGDIRIYNNLRGTFYHGSFHIVYMVAVASAYTVAQGAYQTT